MQRSGNFRGETVTLQITGDLDLTSADSLRTRLEEAIDHGALHLCLDMNQVTFCDSSGLGVLLGRYRRLRQMGGTLTLTGVGEHLYPVFELSGLNRILQIERKGNMAHG